MRNKDWSDAVRDSFKGEQLPIDDALWSRVEESLAAEKAAVVPLARWGVLGMVAAVAAVIAVAIVAFIPRSDKEQFVELQQIADSEPIKEVPQEVAPSTVAYSTPLVVIPQVVESRVVAPVEKVIAESAPIEEEVTSAVNEEQEEEEECEILTAPERDEPRTLSIQRNKLGRRLSLLYAGGVGSSSSSGSAVISRYAIINQVFMSSKRSVDDELQSLYSHSEVEHHQPLGFGLKAQLELVPRLWLGSGVNYTMLRSDLNMVDEGEKMIQKIHFVGVPISLSYRVLDRNNFALYGGLGAGVEYLLQSKIDNRRFEDNRWHYSADLNVGAEYRFNKWLGIYLEPSLSHHFTETKLKSIRNDSPTNFNIRMGLSFSIR